jgi:hypothetical protein
VIEQAKQVLGNAQVPLGFGFPVDEAFMAGDPGGTGKVIDAPQGDIIGGHWVCIAGYRPAQLHVGQTEFLLVNSWGKGGWTPSGTIWITEDRLRSGFDIYGLTIRSV